MEFERYDNGVPSWVDLGSPDLATSRQFYGACSAGTAPRGRPRPAGYSVCDLGGKTVAGLGPQMNPGHAAGLDHLRQRGHADDTVAKVDGQRRHRVHAARWT